MFAGDGFCVPRSFVGGAYPLSVPSAGMNLSTMASFQSPFPSAPAAHHSSPTKERSHRGIKRSYTSFCSGIVTMGSEECSRIKGQLYRGDLFSASAEISRARPKDGMELSEQHAARNRCKQTNIRDFFASSNRHMDREPLAASEIASSSSSASTFHSCILCISPTFAQIASGICNFCSRYTCDDCRYRCENCEDNFCKFCVTSNYDTSLDRTLCLDCNSSVAVSASSTTFFF